MTEAETLLMTSPGLTTVEDKYYYDIIVDSCIFYSGNNIHCYSKTTLHISEHFILHQSQIQRINKRAQYNTPQPNFNQR